MKSRSRSSARDTTAATRRLSYSEIFLRTLDGIRYTPYQAEISQGRLEALVNYQTVITDLTGLPLANSSLLDEGTAAAEAMGMCWSLGRQKGTHFIVDSACHPQTVAVIETRAEPLGITVETMSRDEMLSGEVFAHEGAFGVILQYPDTQGICDERLGELINIAHQNKAKVVVARVISSPSLSSLPRSSRRERR